MKIVPADQTTSKRGQEYCILLYSEKKEAIGSTKIVAPDEEVS